jgi:hypothetical protein
MKDLGRPKGPNLNSSHGWGHVKWSYKMIPDIEEGEKRVHVLL